MSINYVKQSILVISFIDQKRQTQRCFEFVQKLVTFLKMQKKNLITKPKRNNQKTVEFEHVLRSAKRTNQRLLFDATFLLQPKKHQNILMAARKGNCSLTIMNFNIKRNNKIVSTHPVYNRDKKCYTGAFETAETLGLKRSEDYYKEMRKRFNQRVYKLLLKSKQYIYTRFYKPIPLSNFCQVCRVQFQDYFVHIKQQQHKRLFKQPQVLQVNQWISESIQKFRVQNNLPLVQQNNQESQESQIDEVKQQLQLQLDEPSQIQQVKVQNDLSLREKQNRQIGMQKMTLRSKAQTSYKKLRRNPFLNQIVHDTN